MKPFVGVTLVVVTSSRCWRDCQTGSTFLLVVLLFLMHSMFHTMFVVSDVSAQSEKKFLNPGQGLYSKRDTCHNI
jgi:hypothetical protein